VPRCSLGSLIVVFKPNDVIFAQIITQLYLDNSQWFLTAVTQTVVGLRGNMNVLTPTQLQFLITTNDVGNTLHHYPVFASLRMSLQTKSRARLYLEHLYLESGPLFKYFIAAPRSFIKFAH